MRQFSDYQNACDMMLSQGARRGLLYRAAEDETVDGRTFTLDGRELLQFGSGSYLGLETDPRLKAGAIDAIQRYGTQFPSSRSYVSAPLYPELEALLGEIFGMPTIATASSTLAHNAAIPVLIDEKDAVLLDQQVHATVQMAMNHVRVHGVPVKLVRHNRMDLLEERIEALSRHHRRVWYMADGVYSMYGDRVPMAELTALLDRYEQLHLYLDDAHGMSWTGRYGRGHVLEQLPFHPRMTVATSLAKSFSSGGGALVIPDPELRRKVRTVGPSMVFSGPLQPANLGAAIASARLHLSGDIHTRQAVLAERIRFCNRLCRDFGLPLVSDDEVPIRFLALGAPGAAYSLVERLMADGFYANAAVFPAVSMQRAGLRFTITLHQTPEDIERFVSTIARHLPEVLDAEGISLAEVRRAFQLAPPTPASPDAIPVELTTTVAQSALRVQHETTIEAIAADEWDGLLGRRGNFTWAGLRSLEAMYRGHDRPENNWQFHYFVVRDAAGEPVAATFFTDAIWKDDMLSPAAVSARLELERQADPGRLTSRYFAMGALLTEGSHLYLDRTGDWQGALRLLLQAARREQTACGATHLVLRDLPSEDAELGAFLLEQGFAQFSMPDSFALELADLDEATYLARLSHDQRKQLKRKVFPWNEAYDEEVLNHRSRKPSPEEFAHFHSLYRNVKARNLELNTFELPESVFAHMLESPCWEISLLYARPEIGGVPGAPAVALSACFIGPEQYVPVVAGLDYRHVVPHGLYRQLQWRNVVRARAHGAKWIYNGFGAPIEKTRLGFQARSQHVYIQTSDLYQLELLGEMMMASRGDGTSR
jgi:7-keto-8-aminopelargonate synthetase-like enzyme